MTDRGYHELQCDAHRLADVRLRDAIDGGDWLAVNRVCDELSEISFRLYHEAQTRAGLERVRSFAPPGERENR